MRRWRTVASMVALFALTLIDSCTVYYYQSNLNGLAPGTREDEFLSRFSRRDKGLRTLSGAVIRASKTTGDDRLDVVTLEMAPDGMNGATEYWFLFRNKTLVQWGKPEDWREISATYHIDFNPVAGVRAP